MTDADAPEGGPAADGLMKAFLDLRPALIAFARARLKTQADVEDVLQDVAQRLAERPPEAPVHNKTSYLFSVVSNVIVDRIRAGRARHAGRHVPIYDLDLEAMQPNPEETFAARQRLARLSELMAALPADMRESFELSRVKGYTLEDVARMQGVSVHRVRKNIDTALARLSRKVWGE